ncbi:putative epoxide hydrolase [Mycena indigotica]|uniref:Putative epoxide hydrolase n=1 Tax=Mycena indigotica TaxID=2126181 RepID=A0A8H6T3E9_9AGAR|nr:putative epoxide hydrolase [Mycena indigotica]KAF7310174.1 putative epoxide hydrolase [Mycena indigotica]
MADLKPPSVESEKPFTIHVPDEAISRLKTKLSDTIFPDELEGVEWDYGVPMKDLQRLVERWADGFDWRKQEAVLNAEFPQFTRDITVEGHGTLNIHYIHKKSDVKGAIPLLFVHGWPGSFVEARKILPLLTASSPDHPSFHFVGLSIPGYGFSEAPRKSKFGLDQYAEVGNKLMLALGYDEYVTQGGDWGFAITRRIASLYGHKHSKAWHTNFPTGDPPSPIWQPLEFIKLFLMSSEQRNALYKSLEFMDTGMGYMAQHATKPQTLGYALADSPVGLLAWLYEKMVGWSDEYPWTDDEVLTWVSIYWFSRAGPVASTRIYRESAGPSFEAVKKVFQNIEKPTIPFGASHFQKEIIVFPLGWVKTSGKLVYQRAHPRGGHFAAWEKPEELVSDLREMFGRGGKAFGVVKGKDGY